MTLYCSAIHSACNTVKLNRRTSSNVGETDPIKVIKSPLRSSQDGETGTTDKHANVIDPDKLIGRTYLQDFEENGERHRAKIV